MRLAAGLRPDPLGELECSLRPPSRNWGEVLLLREREEREGKGGGEVGKGLEGRKGGERRVKGGDCLLCLTSGYGPEN